VTSSSAAQTTNSSTNHRPESGAKNSWATGLTLFAGVILATVGVSQFFQGLDAIIKGS